MSREFRLPSLQVKRIKKKLGKEGLVIGVCYFSFFDDVIYTVSDILITEYKLNFLT